MNTTRTRPSFPPLAIAAIAAAVALAACDKPATPTAAAPTTATTPASTPAATASAASPDAQSAPVNTARTAGREHAESGIAWRYAANDGEVDAAFAGAAITLAGVALAQFTSSPRDPVREAPAPVD